MHPRTRCACAQVSSSTCSSEEILLGQAIAAFHNAVRPRETPVTEQEARHWNHLCIFRLYNVRPPFIDP